MRPTVGGMPGESPRPTTATDTDPRVFDSKRFRNVLGHFPTSVTVVTAIDDTGTEPRPVGLTIGSFVSVSLDPPLVGFLPTKDSETWKVIERTGRFCVNDLTCLQGDVCWRFATSGNEDERFDGVGWRPGPAGTPILDAALAWIECTVETVHDAGDHVFVTGRVTALDVEPTPEGQEPALPLLFYKGALGRFVAEG